MNYQSAAKNIALIAVIAALLIAAKFVLALLPNIEVVTPLIIIFTCVFKFKRVMFSVLVFCLLDNLIYTFSFLTTIQYFFHWPLLCLLAELSYKIFKANVIAFTALSLIAAIMFWIETSLIYTIFKFALFMPSLMAGIPFMIFMAISGTAATVLLFKPLYSVLIKLNSKYIKNP